MYDRYYYIKRLRPTGMGFKPYIKSPTTIQDAPMFWSSHRYFMERGYHYQVTSVDHSNIQITLESVCFKKQIIFEPISLTLENFVEALQKATQNYENFITLDVPITYKDHEECARCLRENAACSSLWDNMPQESTLQIFFGFEDIKKALHYYLNVKTPKPVEKTVPSTVSASTDLTHKAMSPKTQNSKKETKSMITNFLGMDMRNYGLVKDPNIAATLLGICFKNEQGNWIHFDKKTRQRTNLGNMQFGNLPLYKLPSETVEVGDVIEYESKYCYITDTSNAPVYTAISVDDGIAISFSPAKSPLGFFFFTKVVGLLDDGNLLGGTNDDLFLLMALGNSFNAGNADGMFENGGNDMMQYLLLSSVLKDKKDGADDKGILSGLFDSNSGSLIEKIAMLSMFSGGMNGNPQTGNDPMDLTQLLIMKKILGNTSDGALSSLLGGSAKEVVPEMVADTSAKEVTEKTDTPPANHTITLTLEELNNLIKSSVAAAFQAQKEAAQAAKETAETPEA